MTTLVRSPSTVVTVMGQLELNGRPITGSIISAEITLSEGSHDQADLVVVAPMWEMNYNTVASKTAYFTFAVNDQGRFYGYVVDITPQQKYGDGRQYYKVTLMGPTFVMKAGRPRFFTDADCAEVVALLAKAHHLGFSDEFGTKHYRWPQLAQTDESDWEFAADLVARCGGVLVASNGVLRILDPANVLRRTAPVVYTTRNMDDDNTDIYDFMPAHYTDRLPTQFSPTVGYLSGGQSVVRSHTSQVTLPLAFDASRPLRNMSEAEMAQVRLPVSWEEQASARLRGDYRIEPGSVIYFKTGARQSFDAPYDGLWYVWRVQHSLSGNIHQTKVDVARVSRSAVLPPTPPKFWFNGQRGRPQIIPGQNGQWASTWR